MDLNVIFSRYSSTFQIYITMLLIFTSNTQKSNEKNAVLSYQTRRTEKKTLKSQVQIYLLRMDQEQFRYRQRS